MHPCWAAKMKEDRRINFDDLWKLLVMTFMNILWKVENVIINFYIRKWGRNIKQTALNIERGPHVKRIVSGIMGSLPGQKRWDEKSDDNQTSRVILLLCRDGKVEQPKKMRPCWTALWVFRGSSKVKISSFIHLLIRFVPTTCVVPLNVLCSK